MDPATPTSCILCYEADELGSMVQVEFASRDGLRVTRVVLCRRCASAITAALTAVLADEDQATNDRNLDRIVLVQNIDRGVDPETPQIWGPDENITHDRAPGFLKRDDGEDEQ